MLFVGFDPGGKNAFGWAVLTTGMDGEPRSLVTGCCDTAPAAFGGAAGSLAAAPAAVGIDAPLFWVEAGDRRADQTVRRAVIAHGGHNGTVGAVNSLQGACLVQGILVARHVHGTWPAVPVTEAHPKALLRVDPASATTISRLMPEFDNPRREHERDAALAAYTAVGCLLARPGWRDLALAEDGPFFPAGRPVSYWFPYAAASLP